MEYKPNRKFPIKDTQHRLDNDITRHFHDYLEPSSNVNKTVDYELTSNEDEFPEERRPFEISPAYFDNQFEVLPAHVRQLRSSQSMDEMHAQLDVSHDSFDSSKITVEEEKIPLKRFVSDYVAFGDKAARRDIGDDRRSSSVIRPVMSRNSAPDVIQEGRDSSCLYRTAEFEAGRVESRDRDRDREDSMLEFEREKIVRLEQKIIDKDKIIEEHNKIQTELLRTIELNQKQIKEAGSSKDYEIKRLHRDKEDLEFRISTLIKELEHKDSSSKDNYRKYIEKSHKTIEELNITLEHSQDRISELERHKHILLEENSQLNIKLKNALSDIKSLETQVYSIKEDLRTSKEKESNTSAEIIELRREKMRIYVDFEDMKRKAKEFIQEREKIMYENRELEENLNRCKKALYDVNKSKEYEIQSRIQEISLEISNEIGIQAHRLEDEITLLRRENSALREELRQRPVHKILTKAESDKRVNQKRTRSESVENISADIKKLNIRPKSKGKDLKKRPKPVKEISSLSPVAIKRLLGDLMKEFNIDSTSSLLLCLKDQIKKHKQYTSWEHFIQQITDLILECSPVETFNNPPSLTSIWRWIRRLIEEYLYIKKEQDMNHKSLSVLNLLLQESHIAYPEELIGYLVKLKTENIEFREFIDRIKLVLMMKTYGDRVGLGELEEEIKRKLRV